MHVIYLVEQNVKVSSSNVKHRQIVCYSEIQIVFTTTNTDVMTEQMLF